MRLGLLPGRHPLGSENTLWQRVNGAWEVLWRESTSPMVQRGIVTVAAGTTTGSEPVVFPVAFSDTPVIVVSARATTVWGANESLRAPTGFTANVFRLSGSGAANVAVNWIAVG